MDDLHKMQCWILSLLTETTNHALILYFVTVTWSKNNSPCRCNTKSFAALLFLLSVLLVDFPFITIQKDLYRCGGLYSNCQGTRAIS